ncbi:ABC transporter permease [Pectobacterium actinidiae]|uniref:ABC transporter permease n=1 Tax=Pectobacterium actinidiae TaxID=1507808 RepID=UPI003826EA30
MQWITEYSTLLYGGLRTTLSLLAISAFFGFLLALAVGLARIAHNPLINLPARMFTSIIRGTPLLVQVYLFYYGLGTLFSHFPLIRGSFLWPYLRDGYWYIAFALILSFGAYAGEVIRSGLLAVPRGELEAASAFGMGNWKTLTRVHFPRALTLMLPTLAGETVMLLKSTALASTIAVVDLLGAANIMRSQTFQVYQPLLAVAAVYTLLTFTIEMVLGRIERRLPVRRPQ